MTKDLAAAILQSYNSMPVVSNLYGGVDCDSLQNMKVNMLIVDTAGPIILLVSS